jgi:DNA-3-methyladenine glycosylase
MMSDNEIDLFDPASPVTLTLKPGPAAVAGPRVGVSKAADRPWRLWLAGRPEVSAYRRSPRAPAPGASD